MAAWEAIVNTESVRLCVWSRMNPYVAYSTAWKRMILLTDLGTVSNVHEDGIETLIP